MAISSGFFNSVNGDRRYLASNFADYFASFIGNGVFPNPSTGLQVVESNNMNINVKAGKGWINGYYVKNDGDYNLTLATADGVLNRIDRIVMRLDYSTRSIDIVVKKGTFASSPVAQNLQRDADAYELALADVYVGKGVTSITQSSITDQRTNTSLCGIVKGTVDQIDTTDLFAQYDTSFYEWFETVKDYLNDTAVGNVANELAEHVLDGTAHGIGDKNTLTTAQKSTLVGAINELADYVRTPGYATATGTNAYAVTLNPAPTSYKEGMGLVVKITNASTGAATINVNGLGAKPILKTNGLAVSDLKAGAVYTLRYSGTAFILQGEGGDKKEIATSIMNQVLQDYAITYIDDIYIYAVDTSVAYGGTMAYKILRDTNTIVKTINKKNSAQVITSYTPDGIVESYLGYTSYVYDENGTLLKQENLSANRMWFGYYNSYLYISEGSTSDVSYLRFTLSGTLINTFLKTNGLAYDGVHNLKICFKPNTNIIVMSLLQVTRSFAFMLKDVDCSAITTRIIQSSQIGSNNIESIKNKVHNAYCV